MWAYWSHWELVSALMADWSLCASNSKRTELPCLDCTGCCRVGPTHQQSSIYLHLCRETLSSPPPPRCVSSCPAVSWWIVLNIISTFQSLDDASCPGTEMIWRKLAAQTEQKCTFGFICMFLVLVLWNCFPVDFVQSSFNTKHITVERSLSKSTSVHLSYSSSVRITDKRIRSAAVHICTSIFG